MPGRIDDFPFVEPPEYRLINDGYKLLFELGAIDRQNEITKIGRKIARFPIDPKLARVLLEADKENALSEVLIIVSALATQDPRERPLDKQQAADEKHAVFSDEDSDFILYLNLWNAYHQEKKTLSANQLRKWCRKHFISWMRMREWIDTHKQIMRMLKELNIRLSQSVSGYDSIHRSLLIGLLANIGLKDEGKEFIGARSKKFNVFPGSSLFKSPPKWIMAAEVVETTRVYSRTNAKIDVSWIEEKAKHLLKYHHSNPHWEKKRSQVVAEEQSSLYGLIIYADKKVNYGRINPVESKEIFIRSALIEGDFESKASFFHHNQQLISDLESLEAKSRRRDIVVDEYVLYDFYQEHLPDEVYDGGSLEKWLRDNQELTKRLFLARENLMREDATTVSDSLFPDHLTMNGSNYPIEYHFDPTNHCDGITLITPAVGLNAINPQRCEWLIPGLLHEKIVALIRSLPKKLRKNFVPAPDFASACTEVLEPSDIALVTTVAVHLKKMTGVQIPYDAWLSGDIDAHLLMNFRVIANDGSVIEEGRNLQAIKDKLSGLESDIPPYQHESEEELTCNQDDVGSEILDNMDETVELNHQGITIKAYPALVKNGSQVNLRALDNKTAAVNETRAALRQLVVNVLPDQIKHLKKSIPDIHNLCLKYAQLGRCDDLKQDIVNKTIDDVFLYEEIKTHDEFISRIEKGKADIYEKVSEWSRLLSTILDEYRVIKKILNKPELHQLDVAADMQLQINHLFPKHFFMIIDKQWLQQYPRYLQAISKRFEKSKTNTEKDRQYRIEIADLWDEYIKRHDLLVKQHIDSEQLNYYRWMLEEYRVSLFAQELKTRFPISAKRLKAYWNEL